MYVIQNDTRFPFISEDGRVRLSRLIYTVNLTSCRLMISYYLTHSYYTNLHVIILHSANRRHINIIRKLYDKILLNNNSIT